MQHMSSIKNLLNPDSRQIESHGSMSGKPTLDDPSSPTSASDASGNMTVGNSLPATDEPPYTDHEPHPNCPDTLACLPDTDGRPQHTLPVILRCAILGKKYTPAMENKYSYFRSAGPTWKQSVRHHLSLNRLFERQPRPVTDPGFGSYWTVNLSAPPGTKRPRKRGKTSKTVKEASEPSKQKKRGRPRKAEASSSSTPLAPLPVSAIRTQGHPFEKVEKDESWDDQDECDVDVSQNEYESEEDMVVPSIHHPSTSSLGVFGVRTVPSRVYSPEKNRRAYTMSDESLIDRLQIEMSGLRRQSADAIAVSLRISDQLAEAQAEAARAKAALRAAESMLEEEGRKRREAERTADDEARLRKIAEETTARLQNQWHSASRTG
ncbi:hypothetical protein F5I97DRAFT_1877181 [Phlebopus sp. FC_14]|nr:hypothetical protein F5I97DRAFT_1877181 [Phlebopus sp. FC_14]